jgi:pyruvate,water dikinase
MPTVEYVCADGTPFPVTFASADDVTLEWHLEREHSTQPRTPMTGALGALGRPGGARAYEEAGLPFPSLWRVGPDAHGFPYMLPGPPPPDEMAAYFTGCGKLVEEYGSALGIWRDFSLPRVQAACAAMDAAPEEVPLADLAELHDYALQHTMVSSMVTWNDMRLVAETIAGVFGSETELVAGELAQGFANDTITADERLYALARLASGVPDLASALQADDPAAAMAKCRAANTQPEFFAALDAFLAEFGGRAEMWTADSPTWREQRAGFWAQLRHFTRPDVLAPSEALRRAAARRDALIAAVHDRLDASGRDRFDRRVERLAPYVSVREDRARWQLTAAGSLRGAIRRRGAALAARSLIDDPDDIFFLRPDEVDATPDGWRDAIAARRAEHEHWCRVSPPLRIGRVTATDDTAQPATRLRGVAASRGVRRGRARVIVDLADADRLAPGDVLVCVMTSPAWTPLLAVAGALVTDTGMISSHPAIAAREYGLPCVVGTEVATSVIPDGADVIVDGGAGTVEVEAR